MTRGWASWKRNKEKSLRRAKFDRNPERALALVSRRRPIPSLIPDTQCLHCKPEAEDKDADNFDENGYPLPRVNGHVIRHAQTKAPTSSVTGLKTGDLPFRFLDLPAEVRNMVYEYVLQRPGQPICIPDSLLRRWKALLESDTTIRSCTNLVMCLPCQLHNLLGIGNLSLSRASKQLHAETIVIPYTVNTFSVHNLYYLDRFLRLIGTPGRRALTSLRFTWKLPEEEAHALGLYTPIEETYALLGECCSLDRIDVDLDVINMLTWRTDGNPRSLMLNFLSEIPEVQHFYGLRGVKHVSISWQEIEGLQGMESWARTLAGTWRLPCGVGYEEATPVDGGSEMTTVGHVSRLTWDLDRERALKDNRP